MLQNHLAQLHPGPPHSPPSRRGVACVAAVIALVVLQLMLVGAIILGARDQDTTINRLHTVRAFYAAEAGINMAVREVMQAIDEDADGAIGSVSSDGNAANDPLFVTARVAVARTTGSGLTTLTSNSRSDVVRRRVSAEFVGTIGGNPQTVVAAWGRSGSSQPRYSAWNGTTWLASAAMPSIGSSNIKWVRMKLCPARNETMFIAESDDDRVNILFFNGSSWSSPFMVSSDTGGTNDRPEDCAYEQLSHNGLSMYWKGDVSRFGYRRYDGTTFLAENLVNSPFTTENDWLTLAARPNSNEIMALAVDGIAGGPLVASLWNGSSFGPWTTITPSLETNNEECFAMVFESLTRRGMCVYIPSGSVIPRYRTWNGFAWSAEGMLPALGGVGKWVRLAADPGSNTIVCGTLDSQNDVRVAVWNGSSWFHNLQVESSTAAFDRRQFDVLCERGTGRALVVYAESGVTTPRYRVWNGINWTNEMSLPSIGSNPQIVHLARGFGPSEAFAAISDASRRLHLLRWDGSSWGAGTIVETSLSGDAKQQSFSLPEPTPAPNPRLRAWIEVAPDS